MLSLIIFSLLSLIPGLGLILLGYWKRALVIMLVWLILLGKSIQSDTKDQILFLLLLGVVWAGQYIYTLWQFQRSLDDESAAEIGVELNEFEEGGEIPPEFYLGKPASLLGWPGYRSRSGRSGYDPIETQMEAAHIQGLFIYHVLTGSLITNEPIYLFLLLAGGTILVFSLLFPLVGAFLWPGEGFKAWGVLLIPFLIGVSFLISFCRSVIKMKKGTFDEEIISEKKKTSERQLLISKIVFFALVSAYLLFRAIPVLAPLFSERKKSTSIDLGHAINAEFENTLGNDIEFNSGLRLKIIKWEDDAVSEIRNYAGEMIVFENDLLGLRRFCFKGDLTAWFPIEVDEEPYFEEELILTLNHQFTSPNFEGMLIVPIQQSSDVEIMHQFECDILRVFIEGKGIESGLRYGAYDDLSVGQFSEK